MRDAVQSLACKGENLNTDDVQVYNLGISILESNLPSLLPNMCRCWLDEDCDVRDLAIQLFGDLLSNLSRQSKVGADGGVTSHLTCLVPFVPFLCAYASSALNCLDRSIRKDGALLVGMMSSCTPYPSFSLLNGQCTNSHDTGSDALKTEVGKHVYLFLPPLERLLSSMSFGTRTKAKSTSGGGKNDRKRKRDPNKPVEATANGFKLLGSADTTILSLSLLLNASLKDNNISHESLESNIPDSNDILAPSLIVSGECAFLQGGSASANSVFFFRRVQQQDSSVDRPMKPIKNTLQLPLMPEDESIVASSNGDKDTSNIHQLHNSQLDGIIEKARTLSTLVETLRIKFVELTQVGRSSNNHQKGTMLPASDLDTLDALIQALKHTNLCAEFFRRMVDLTHLEDKSKDFKRQKKTTTAKAHADSRDIGLLATSYQSSISKTVSLILENFPICSLDGKSSTSRYNLTNAGLCYLLAEIREPSSLWIDAVFSYIVPRLIPEEHNTSNFGIGDGDDSLVVEVLLNIARKLILPIGVCKTEATYLLKSESKRQELLQVFGDVFFPHKLIQGSTKTIEQLTEDGQGLWLKKFAFTSAGRNAAMLLISLMSWLDDDFEHLNERTHLFILQMASILPLYLLSWGHQYPIQSGMVLSSMISVARRLSPVKDESTAPNTNIIIAREKLCGGYRTSINIIFNRTKVRGPDQIQAKDTLKPSSIFERSIEPIQKLSIGLVSILGSPNELIINSLAKICSRAFLPQQTGVRSTSTAMSEYILEVMHNMRKTMQVSTYLAFLINASGIEKASLSDNAPTDGLFLRDNSIKILCRFLVCSRDTDPSKVLSMIHPTLNKWLSELTGIGNSAKQIIRARSAISIVAAFIWNEVYPQIGCHRQTVQSEVLKLDETFDQFLLNAMLGVFELIAVAMDATKAKQSEEYQQRVVAHLLGPISIILCYRDGMLMKYLQMYSERIANLTNDEQNNKYSNSWIIVEIHIITLLALLRSKVPTAVASLIQHQSDLQDLLLYFTNDIEKFVSKSHLKHLSETLSHEVDHIIKLAPSKNE